LSILFKSALSRNRRHNPKALTNREPIGNISLSEPTSVSLCNLTRPNSDRRRCLWDWVPAAQDW